MTRTVTVFGGSGFIGRHVVQRLARQGAVVRVAVRRPDLAAFLKPLGNVGQIVPRACNVLDTDSIAAMVEGSDAVINLTGILYERGRRSFQAMHVDAPKAIAEACAAQRVDRLVHMAALGADAGSESRYASSKGAGEQAVRAAFPRAAILRPSVVFGPEDDFFNRFAGMARLSPVLPVITSAGKPDGPRFQPVYVGDVADAVMAAEAGVTYELGGPRTYTMAAIMAYIMQEIRRSRRIMRLPAGLAMIGAYKASILPVPPLTPDQVRLLRRDNVVEGDLPGFAALGITPTTVESIVPSYLARYRPLHKHVVLRPKRS